MTYSTHRIKKDGHIEVREKTDKGFHRYVISPNQPVEKYNEEIEADPDFERFRTQENADAYEAKLAELEPTPEELAEQEKQRKEKEKRQKALERLIEKEMKEMEKE